MYTRLLRKSTQVCVVAVSILFAATALSCTSSGREEEDPSPENRVGQDENPAGSGTTPQDPHPSGSSVELADWTITLSNLRFAVTDEVLEADPYGYGIGPSSGNEFSTFTIEGTYNGPTSSALWLEFSFGMWADGAFYLPCPATTAEDIYMTPEVSSGNTVTATICIEIPTVVEQVVPYLEQISEEEGSTRTFIAIDADAPEELPTDGTSSKAPLPAGSAAEIGRWTVTPSNLRLDMISHGDSDLWGDLPSDRQIVFYDVSGVYSGSSVASLSYAVDVGIWSEGAFYQEGCDATFDGDWSNAPDVENGGTTSGTACAEIPDEITEISALLFYVSLENDAGGPTYFIEVE